MNSDIKKFVGLRPDAVERHLSACCRCNHMPFFVFPIKNNEDRHDCTDIARTKVTCLHRV